MNKTVVSTDPSCADDYDPNSLSVTEALHRIDIEVEAVRGIQKLAIRDTLDRVLAEDIISPIDVPSHTNSAMDGYAVRIDDVPADGTHELELVGSAFAGSPFAGEVGVGQCVRIMTGAVLPAGSDTVVMQEHAEALQERIRIGAGHRCHQNVRDAGEDIKCGTTVLRAGTRLRPAELGLLASLGFAELRVRRRPRIAFFSTGDELKSIGESLGAGDVYDSNRYTLYGMLTRLGAEIIDMGVVSDVREDLRRGFREASEVADAVITSGGVSVGEADFVREILSSLGQVSFWKIAMKPGRPLAFGRLGEALFFGLPGNPVSVMVTFYQFVQPALRRMMGELDPTPVSIPVRCISELRKRPGRTEFQRGILYRDEHGELLVRSTGQQGSGILTSVSQANCFIVLPDNSTGNAPDDMVEVQPFEGMV